MIDYTCPRLPVIEFVRFALNIHVQGVPKKERHFKYICKVANN